MNDESRFDNEENDDLIELTDEDGVTTTFEILAQFPFKGENFVAVSAPEQDENDEDLEVLLLQVAEDENGEEILVTPDSDIYDEAFDHFMELVEQETMDEPLDGEDQV